MSLPRRIAPVAVVAAVLAGSIAIADDRPLRSGITEGETVWLSVLRVRIEPGRHAALGECQDLGPDDVVVVADGREYSGAAEVQIDRRRPPTLHAIVLDTSSSMAADLAYARHAAEEYVRQLRTDRERALIATFDENVILWQAYTADVATMLAAIDAVRMGSRTAMLDAMVQAMRELDAHRERPVLILLTDGADTASLFDVADIERQVAARPDLTVFTIGVGLRTQEGVKPTRQLLRRLAETTDGEFFDVAEGQSLAKVFASIRDTLEKEAFVTVVDPDPRARRGSYRIRSKRPNCDIHILGRPPAEAAPDPSRRPIPRPYPDPPVSYETPLDPAQSLALDRVERRTVEPECGAGRFFDLAFRQHPIGGGWRVHVGQGRISGCGPDLAMENGLLHSAEADDLVFDNPAAHLVAREFEIALPALDALPDAPEAALDTIASHALTGPPAPDGSPAADGEPPRGFLDYPMLVAGRTLLEMRGMLARAAFLYPDYRTFALARLDARSTAEMAALVEHYRKRFPDAPDEAVLAVARHSDEGTRIRAAAESPSEIDLEPYLAAWLGDLTAHEMFLRWERRRIARDLADRDRTAEDDFDRAWAAIRPLFAAPDRVRTLALLVPVHDPECDCIGYWRVVLPRPGWMRPRTLGLTAGKEFSGGRLDLVPERPLALAVWRAAVAGVPGLADFVAARGWRPVESRYELLGDPAGHEPGRAFDRSRVELLLAGDDGAGGTAGIRFVVDTGVRSAPDGSSATTFDVVRVFATPDAVPADLASGIAAWSAAATSGPPPAGRDEPEAAPEPETPEGFETLRVVRPVPPPPKRPDLRE